MIWAARARSLVCGLLVLVVLLYLCPSWLPPARRLDSAKLPVLTRTNQIDAHTEIRHGAGCKLIPVCFARRVHSPQAIHAMSGKDRATFRCSGRAKPGTTRSGAAGGAPGRRLISR